MVASHKEQSESARARRSQRR